MFAALKAWLGGSKEPHDPLPKRAIQLEAEIHEVERLFGPEAARLVPLLFQLSAMRESSGDFAGAEAATRRQIEVGRKNAASEASLAQAHGRVARLLRAQGKLEEA